MNIEDVIKIFNTVLLFGKCDCQKEEIEECFKMAIDSVSKYQNIEQILDNWNEFKYDDNEALRLISEVVYKD